MHRLRADEARTTLPLVGRRYALSLVMLIAVASCTSAPRPGPTAEPTGPYARYYIVAPKDTGVFEVWASSGNDLLLDPELPGQAHHPRGWAERHVEAGRVLSTTQGAVL